MIVVDTNILLYLWFPGPMQGKALNAHALDDDWISTPLWRSEFRNTAAGFIRKELFPYQKVITTILQAEKQMQEAVYPVESISVMEKVRQSHCSAYDCEFVALAERMGCLLLTNDKQLKREFPNAVVTLDEYLKT